MLLPVGLMAGWRIRLRSVALLRQTALGCVMAGLVAAGMFGLAGCGSGRAIPPATTGVPVTSGSATPSGSYPIVVSATSGGLTQSIGLTLVVQ